MSVVVPDKIPLDMPPGDVDALEELVLSVAGAAHWLAVLSDDLAGPATAAPGWLGADAVAAEVQVGRVAVLARESAAAVLAATGRLSAHSDLLRDARRVVSGLRSEQDEDYRATWSRLQDLDDVVAQIAYDGAAAVAIAEEFRAGEAGRRRRHEAVTTDVVEDAAATARLLHEACAVVGGTGRRGDDGRVLAHLAALLPGWGDAELAARGTAMAHALVGDEMNAERRDSLADEAAAYAGNPAFAGALLAALGRGHVSLLFDVLGTDRPEDQDGLARLLASAFGAAVPSGPDARRIEDVLSAVYVHPDERDSRDDAVAAGMAVVLLAGRSAPGGGPRPETAAGWARQLLLREHEQGITAGAGALPSGSDPELYDPAALAMGVLAEAADPALSAELLGDPDIWETVLGRFWGDGGAALSEVVMAAGRAPGEAGARAVRTGLELVGADLVPGDPSDRIVSRLTVDAVSPALARAASEQVEVVVDVLSVGVDGLLGGREDALRGLGYVTLDPAAASSVDRALEDWSRVQPTGLEGTGPLMPLPAVAVPAAFIAAREYGQRLAFALHGFEAQRDAENAETFWNWTFGLAATIVGLHPGPVGTVVPLIADYVQVAIGSDGTWDNGIDRGLRFTGDDAADGALAELDPQDAAAAAALALQAQAAYERTATALGTPRPPTSPESDLLAPWVDAVVGEVAGRAGDRVGEWIKEIVQGLR